jgi:glycosyltransferase involved in cell wall biosynthesis
VKILFVSLSGLSFTVATPEHEPLGGTESCICYLARQLATTGHHVTLMTRLPEGTPEVVHGVRHCPTQLAQNATFFKAENFDVIIVSNAVIAAPFLRDLNPKTKIILWNHVAPDHDMVREIGHPDVLNAIDTIVYVSQWQKSRTEAIHSLQKNAVVIGNGLTPAFENMFASADDLLRTKQNRAAYTTTPFRGLSQLLHIMDGVKGETKLDIYSSMRVYQVSANKDRHADLYEQARHRPYVTYHAPVSQTELAARLRASAFLFYPSTYAETFCNVTLEALAAGMKIITTDLGALPESTMGFADIVPFNRGDDTDIENFRSAIDTNVQSFHTDPNSWATERFEQLQIVNKACTWRERANSWDELLTSRPR